MIELRQVHPEIVPAITRLFAGHKRVDMTLDSILAGQCGSNISITVDNASDPQTVQIRQGPFVIFAGDPGNDTAHSLIEELPPGCYIMPVPDEWITLARKIHGERLLKTNRYSCSGINLDLSRLADLAGGHPELPSPQRIDYPASELMMDDELHCHHFGNFLSIEHFLDTGFGYCIREHDRVIAACTSSLVSSQGVEVSITTRPDDRRKGVATLVAAWFLMHCLKNNLYPHWDAGNMISVNLAQKLGYQYIDFYDVYYLKRF